VKIKEHISYHFKSIHIIKERISVNYFILWEINTQITNFFQIKSNRLIPTFGGDKRPVIRKRSFIM